MPKPNIAIVSGGYSSEVRIAYQSARNVYKQLSTLPNYNIFLLDLNPRTWEAILEPDIEKCRVPVDKNDFSIIGPDNCKIRFDLALIMMHGSPGEDGKLQGYFELIGQRYLGCSAFASALSNHKYETNIILANQGILTPKSWLVRPDYDFTKLQQSLNNEQLPLFVKANTGGSSIAMSKVKSISEIPSALDKVFQDSQEAIIETQIVGRELTIGAYKLGTQVQTLPITEICLAAEQEYFDFQAKYSGETQEITPANIPIEKAKELAALSIQIYEVLNLEGIVRLDFIYQESADKFYFLEVNTIPGQTQHSILPQQLDRSNYSLKDLYVQLIDQMLIGVL